jgi:hypothetical protein
MEWQPIETAPRDGSRFHVWHSHYGLLTGSASMQSDHGGWLIVSDGNRSSWKGSHSVTHWFPFPDPPKPAEG